MSDQEIRENIRSALAAIVNNERDRVSTVLNSSKSRMDKGIEKLKPVLALLQVLKDEVGEIDGLEINIADHGHMATVRAETSVSFEMTTISTNYENTAFSIEEYSSFSFDNSTYNNKKEFYSAEDVVAQVMAVVGKHIGSQQAQQMHRDG